MMWILSISVVEFILAVQCTGASNNYKIEVVVHWQLPVFTVSGPVLVEA